MLKYALKTISEQFQSTFGKVPAKVFDELLSQTVLREFGI